jgi:hypothetical protein
MSLLVQQLALPKGALYGMSATKGKFATNIGANPEPLQPSSANPPSLFFLFFFFCSFFFLKKIFFFSQ